MGELTARNFGLLIAYFIPGFIALWGLAVPFPTITVWLSPETSPSVGGFLYVSIGSIAAGVTVSAVRWALVDKLHHVTGVRRPDWNDGVLATKLVALEHLIEVYYRYYQFYANAWVATWFAYGIWRFNGGGRGLPLGGLDGAVLFLGIVFAAGSRDTLQNYYRSLRSLMGAAESEVGDDQRATPLTGGNGGDDVKGDREEGKAGRRQGKPRSQSAVTPRNRPERKI